MASVKQAWINKYGEEEGLRRWHQLNEGKGTLSWYVKRYGEIEGKQRYEEKNKKLSVSIETLERAGKTPDEIRAIRENHKNKSKQTLANMIVRYGEEEGLRRHNQYRERNKLTSNRRLDYWINKCSGDIILAKQMLREWQSRDLSWFINKYGPVDGQQRYHSRNKKQGRTLENYIIRFGEKVGYRKYKEACQRWKAGQRGVFNSSGQLEVETFLRECGFRVQGSRTETGIILSEQEKSSILQNNTIYPDMIVNGKYVVEYNGCFWHAHPDLFPEDTTIVGRINKPAGVIRSIDKQKHTILSNRGYEVIVVWENDWQCNKQSIKEQLKKAIK